ncbi:hypothetical protein BDW27_114132, partial [Nocardiopsis sp. L17-MgMaSL7]
PKQTWLKENQTRAVEFSRNNHSSRTSARTEVPSALPEKAICVSAVVSLLYQVFRAPPNRRFRFKPDPEKEFPVLRPLCVSAGLLKQLPELTCLERLLEPPCLRGGCRRSRPGSESKPRRPRSPSRSDSFDYRGGGCGRQLRTRNERRLGDPGLWHPARGPHIRPAPVTSAVVRQQLWCPNHPEAKPAPNAPMKVVDGGERVRVGLPQRETDPRARASGRQPLRTTPPMLRLPLRSTTKRSASTSSALSVASTSVTFTLFT